MKHTPQRLADQQRAVLMEQYGFSTFSVHRAQGIGRFLVLAEPTNGWTDSDEESKFLAELRNYPRYMDERAELLAALQLMVREILPLAHGRRFTAPRRAAVEQARQAIHKAMG